MSSDDVTGMGELVGVGSRQVKKKQEIQLELMMTQETQVSSGPRNVITKFEDDLGSDAAILSSTCAHCLSISDPRSHTKISA